MLFTDCLADIEQMPTEHDIARDAGHTEGNEFKRVMRVRAVHLLAFYILIYVGVEVTLGGLFNLLQFHDFCADVPEKVGW
jgi:fucose permease